MADVRCRLMIITDRDAFVISLSFSQIQEWRGRGREGAGTEEVGGNRRGRCGSDQASLPV